MEPWQRGQQRQERALWVTGSTRRSCCCVQFGGSEVWRWSGVTQAQDVVVLGALIKDEGREERPQGGEELADIGTQLRLLSWVLAGKQCSVPHLKADSRRPTGQPWAQWQSYAASGVCRIMQTPRLPGLLWPLSLLPITTSPSLAAVAWGPLLGPQRLALLPRR